MSLPSQQIGFDRFIRLDWATAALQVRAGTASMDELSLLLDGYHAGGAAKRKTQTVLNRIWLDPTPDLTSFSSRGVDIFSTEPNTPVLALTWGMASSTYPFFGKVSEFVGRLTALTGDCSSYEVHRRMTEVYGDREGTRRMTNMVLQSQENWGAIDRKSNKRIIVRRKPISIQDSAMISWLVESCLRYVGGSISLASIENHPLMYPFNLDESISYALSKSEFISLRCNFGSDQVAFLKDI